MLGAGHFRISLSVPGSRRLRLAPGNGRVAPGLSIRLVVAATQWPLDLLAAGAEFALVLPERRIDLTALPRVIVAPVLVTVCHSTPPSPHQRVKGSLVDWAAVTNLAGRELERPSIRERLREQT